MPLEDRIAIATQMLSPERKYGQATELAHTHGVSRQDVYYIAGRAHTALEVALLPRSGPAPAGNTLTVTPIRLERAVVTLGLLGVSERDSLIGLEEMLDTRRSPGYVAKVLRKAEHLAQARNIELPPSLSGLLASDEIFLRDQPILGIVHPASLYLTCLSLTAQRDGETWGCQFLDLAGADGVISDAGSGLAAGAHLAQVACHAGDWFHPLHLAAWVDAQYERRAYSALAEQYEREDSVLQAQTSKRLENHWQKYEAARAAADQAIERYDQWRERYLKLRALAAQFDWTTGLVCLPEQLQADLQALATDFQHWAQDTRAQALVSLLKNQAVALTAALPHLQHALAPLLHSWGVEATRMVCRLWQALQDWAFPFWRPEQRRQLEQAITESLAWAAALASALSTPPATPLTSTSIFTRQAGSRAVPLAERSGFKQCLFDAAGLPLCRAGLPMPLRSAFICGTILVEHKRGRFACPLVFPQPTGQPCPCGDPHLAKGGCLVTMSTCIGARIRYQLNRDSDLYKHVYK